MSDPYFLKIIAKEHFGGSPGDECELILRASTEIEHLRKLVAAGEAVVEDFMKNIAHCALQDYGRLNQFLIDASQVTKSRSNES